MMSICWEPSLAQTQATTFEDVVQIARRLSTKTYIDPSSALPDAWKDLDYDDYRKITFRNKRALWKGDSLFELEFFHPGFYYDQPVRINVIDQDETSAVPYSADLFDFGDLDTSEMPTDGLGFAGFRINYPLNSIQNHEFAVFLGASYFRVVGREQRYGLSLRGLAVNTATGGGEEFPVFREFWIQRPSPTATTLTLYALLDGPSITGAYRFVLRPSTISQVDVKAVLFPRRDIAKLGIAPLTSMFFYGEDHTYRVDDFRPEVHDSDGLMMQSSGGEWLWRPLVNRRNLSISSFFDTNPRGFGLSQRDRDFNNYQDFEALYHQRASVWVQPLSDWGAGRVELVEIPTDQEINDNIVAYWVPQQPVTGGQRLEFSYVANAYLDHADWPPGGRSEATRTGSARHAAQQQPADSRLFVIDFAQGDLPALSETQPVTAVVSASSGSISEPIVQKNEHTGGWRVFFYFHPEGSDAADLRCFLKLRDAVLTETWNYLWKRQ